MQEARKIYSLEQAVAVINGATIQFKTQLLAAGFTATEVDAIERGTRRSMAENIIIEPRDILAVLCSGDSVIKKTLDDLGMDRDMASRMYKPDLQRELIKMVGIDAIIDAAYLTKQDEMRTSMSHLDHSQYEAVLAEMRRERGREVAEAVRSKKSVAAREPFLQEQSIYAMEDCIAAAGLDKDAITSFKDVVRALCD